MTLDPIVTYWVYNVFVPKIRDPRFHAENEAMMAFFAMSGLPVNECLRVVIDSAVADLIDDFDGPVGRWYLDRFVPNMADPDKIETYRRVSLLCRATQGVSSRMALAISISAAVADAAGIKAEENWNPVSQFN